MKKVTVIILTKTASNIIRCLENLFKQTYKDFQIKILNTGFSFDDKIKFKKWLSKNNPNKYFLDFNSSLNHSLKESGVINEIPFFLYTQNTFNYSKDNNKLANDSNTEYLLFLNDDVYVENNKCFEFLMKTVEVKSINSNIGTIGSRLQFIDESIQHEGISAHIRNDGKYTFSHVNYGKRHDKDYMKLSENNIGLVFGNTGAFLLIEKEKFNKVNGFNESYLSCFQDVELNIKMLELGYHNFIVLFNNVFHDESSTRNLDKVKDNNLMFLDAIAIRNYIDKMTDKNIINKFIKEA